jgi:hypothetical protein
MRKFTLTFAATLAALPLALAVPSMAQAAPCRDTHGKFIKCPPAKPAPAVKKVVVTKQQVTVKKGPCKDAKGKFIKCK